MLVHDDILTEEAKQKMPEFNLKKQLYPLLFIYFNWNNQNIILGNAH